MIGSSDGKTGVTPPGRGPAPLRRDRGLPSFSLNVGRGPASLAGSAEHVDVSQPGDPLERAADETADRAIRRLAAGPGDAASDAPLPPPAFAPRPLVQRASLVEVAAEATGLTGGLEGGLGRAGGLIVDDEAEALTAGQMRKTPFLDELRRIACEAADRELRKVGRTADGCPYLDQLLARYAARPASALERSIRRYAPEARGASRALEYLGPVATKLGRGVATWATTGRMPEADGMSPELTPAGLAGDVGSLSPQRQAADGSAGPSSVDAAALSARLGPGQPLDGAARSRMESAFGHPIGDVRVHADDQAAALAHDLDARAFTLGPHIAFGTGEFRPGSPTGDALLAHELAHVAQQGAAAPRGDVPIVQAGDESERDADRAAEAVVTNLHAPSAVQRRVRPQRVRGGLRLQRCGASYRPRSPADLEGAIPLIRTLRDTHGVAVAEESANWSPDEVSAIHQAFGLLTDQERAQLGTGVVFIRVASTETTSGGVSAQAVTDTGAVREGGTPTRVKRIRVGNNFASLPASAMVRVVVHELGHILESARAHDTRIEVMRTADAIEPARQATIPTHSSFAAAWNTTAGPGGKTSTYTGPETTTFSAFFTAADGAAQAYTALRDTANEPAIENVIRDQPVRDAALTTALADRDREWTALASSSPGHRAIADFRDVISAMDAAVRDLRAYIAARIANQQAARAHAAAVTGTDPNEQSNRLLAFQRIVDANGYGPLRWPDGPSDPNENYTGLVLRRDGRAAFIREMFAEAFSMWRTERAALQAQAPALVTFFDNGEHLR